MSTPTQFNFPPTFLSRLQDASEKYTIRPFHPTDLKPCTEIFIQGMLEYNGQGTNKRTPFPTLDSTHQQVQLESEPKWEQGFQHYVDYSMIDPNMSNLINYWSLPRRSIYLVAIENKTNQVVGSVAIQPGTLLASCKYFDPYKQSIQLNSNSRQESSNNDTTPSSTPSTTPLPSKSTSKTILNDDTIPFPIQNPMSLIQLWCNYAVGSIPGEFYRLDDPTVEPASFIPFPTVILPTPTTSNTTITSASQTKPNPITNAKCSCSQHGTCKSNTIAIKISKLNTQQRIDFVKNINFNTKVTTTTELDTPIASTEQCSTKSTDTTNNQSNGQIIDVNDLFCSCIMDADTQLDQIMQLCFNHHNLSNNKEDGTLEEKISKLLPCPFCIEDVQYLIQPFIPHTESTQSNQQYQINPILATYSNIFTNAIPSTITFTQPITTRLPFSKITPHGYFRRFNRAGTYTANLNKNDHNKSSHLDEFPIVQFPTKLPVGLTPNTYLNFLLDEEEYSQCNKEQLINNTNDEQNCHEDDKYKLWLNHINITPSLQDSIPYPKATSSQRSQLISTTTNTQNTTSTTPESTSQQILQLPWGDICEFRRMSVARPHRSSGLGYVLLLAALQTAFQVFKFKRLHLSTSWVMDTACRFYRKCGLREVLADYEALYGNHCIPIAHFTYQFTPVWIQSFKYKDYIIRYDNTIAPEYNNVIAPWFDSYLTPEFQQLESLQCIADQFNGGCNGDGHGCEGQQ